MSLLLLLCCVLFCFLFYLGGGEGGGGGRSRGAGCIVFMAMSCLSDSVTVVCEKRRAIVMLTQVLYENAVNTYHTGWSLKFLEEE